MVPFLFILSKSLGHGAVRQARLVKGIGVSQHFGHRAMAADRHQFMRSRAGLGQLAERALLEPMESTACR